LGEKVPFNPKTQKLGDNGEVVATFQNLTNNLQGVGVKLEETSYQLGQTLTLDPKTERFVGVGAEKANAFLTRNYRKPFVVPENVLLNQIESFGKAWEPLGPGQVFEKGTQLDRHCHVNRAASAASPFSRLATTDQAIAVSSIYFETILNSSKSTAQSLTEVF